MDMRGIEPLAFCMQSKRDTDTPHTLIKTIDITIIKLNVSY